LGRPALPGCVEPPGRLARTVAQCVGQSLSFGLSAGSAAARPAAGRLLDRSRGPGNLGAGASSVLDRRLGASLAAALVAPCFLAGIRLPAAHAPGRQGWRGTMVGPAIADGPLAPRSRR